MSVFYEKSVLGLERFATSAQRRRAESKIDRAAAIAGRRWWWMTSKSTVFFYICPNCIDYIVYDWHSLVVNVNPFYKHLRTKKIYIRKWWRYTFSWRRVDAMTSEDDRPTFEGDARPDLDRLCRSRESIRRRSRRSARTSGQKRRCCVDSEGLQVLSSAQLGKPSIPLKYSARKALKSSSQVLCWSPKRFP